MSCAKRVSAIAFVTIAACGGNGRPIVYDRDACDFCRMTISDRRFGAEVVTAKGKIRTFDSIECLASFVAGLDGSEAPRAILVTDYDHPGTFIDAERARYLRVSGPGSPMGGGLMAFAANADTAMLVRRSGGQALGWAEVLQTRREKARTDLSPDGSRATTPRAH